MRFKTWKVLEWVNEPDNKGDNLPLQCTNCGRDAFCPSGILLDGFIIAIKGMGIFTDPPSLGLPDNFLPTTIECRGCGMMFGTKDSSFQENYVRENIR